MKIELNKNQKSASLHKDGPALVLAVPGAGKTTVLIQRTRNLIEMYNVNPNDILSITFSRASANDMRERFNSMFGSTCCQSVKFSTIHSFSYTILREYAFRKNIKYTLIEGQNKQVNKNKLLKKIYYDLNGEYITEENLEGIVNTVGFIKNMMYTVDDFLEINKIDIKNFKEIYNAYENYKSKYYLLDFDDMLLFTYRILNKDKYLLNKYRNKYSYVQVDEGQDTSKLQMEIVKTVAAPKNNLFIVADDDQSIYGFRGAFPKGLLHFDKDYPNAKLFYMEENYRSSKNIVNVCNKFIKQNTLRYNKELFTKNSTAKPIQIIRAETVLDQYEYLINELNNHNDYSNTAILYRNNLSALGLIEYLGKNNIPFYIRDKKISFYNQWIVKDIVEFLKVAYNDTDIQAFENIYYKMKGFTFKKYVTFAKTLDYNMSVFDRLLKYPGLSIDYVQLYNELKKDFRCLAKLKPKDAIEFIESSLKYERYLKENSIKFGYTYDSLKTILFDLKLIAENTDNIKDFLGRLKYLDYLISQSSEEKSGVTLTTIHSAKGLEFKNVYMIDLIDGDFPTSNSIEAFDKGKFELLEEERRLFYVGMTRAKEILDLVTVKFRNDKIVEPSRFLVELDELFSE